MNYAKVVTNNSEAPTQNTILFKLDDMNADVSQGGKIRRELFCDVGKDLEFINIGVHCINPTCAKKYGFDRID